MPFAPRDFHGPSPALPTARWENTGVPESTEPADRGRWAPQLASRIGLQPQ